LSVSLIQWRLHAEFTAILLLITRAADATSPQERIEPNAYAEFRARLLRCIGLEETILLPGSGGGVTRGVALDWIQAAARSRRPHRSVGSDANGGHCWRDPGYPRSHSLLEESPDGVYEQCEQLAGAEADEF
jgi:hypothetical protein